MEKLNIKIILGFGIKTDIIISVWFKYNKDLENVFRKIHFSKKINSRDKDLFDRYTRHIIVDIGLVNYVEYYVWYKHFRPIFYRTSKRVRYSPELLLKDIKNISFKDVMKKVTSKERDIVGQFTLIKNE